MLITTLFSRNQFTIYKEQFFIIDDVYTGHLVLN